MRKQEEEIMPRMIADAELRVKEANDASCASAKEDGFDDGHAEGYHEGYQEGFQDGQGSHYLARGLHVPSSGRRP
jgi:flagellar biosynthesis/type III secretory pathway protein FliH